MNMLSIEQELKSNAYPGSDDFVGAAITALNVTDTAILLLNGQYGPNRFSISSTV